MVEEFNSSESPNSDLIYSPSVLEFVTVANEYCKFLENTASVSKKDFIEKSHKLLAFLYQKAVLLPHTENVYEGSADKFVGEQDWAYIKSAIEAKLVSNDIFIDLPDALDPNSDNSVSQSISECFADIYQDVKDFITAYNIGTTDVMNDSLWDIRNSFQTYWGQRVLALLAHLHLIVYGIDELADESYKRPGEKNIITDNWFSKEILGQEE